MVSFANNEIRNHLPNHIPTIGEVYFYHSNHLGGAAWITDMSGKPVQYLHYAPYGELVANQMPYGIDERFKFDTGGVAKLRGMELQMQAFTPFAVVFTGKERDTETGYDNHDARYRWSVSGDWLSVDPLVDKYIDTQPYLYCNGDPVGYIDPNGRDWYENENGEITWTDYHSQKELKQNNIKGKYLGEAVLVFNGYKDEHFGTKNGKGKYLGGENAKLADVTLYGHNGADDITRGLYGFTMSSDYETYGAIDDGIWPANYDPIGKSGSIPSHWTLNKRGMIPTYDFRPNTNPYEKRLQGTMYKDGIFIHSTRYSNNRVGNLTSQGCLLLDWNSMNTFNSKMKGVSDFSVIVRRK